MWKKSCEGRGSLLAIGKDVWNHSRRRLYLSGSPADTQSVQKVVYDTSGMGRDPSCRKCGCVVAYRVSFFASRSGFADNIGIHCDTTLCSHLAGQSERRRAPTGTAFQSVWSQKARILFGHLLEETTDRSLVYF